MFCHFMTLYLIKIMEIFDDSREIINDLVEKKVPILRNNSDFNQKYVRLNNAINELSSCLSKNQINLFNEIINLFYQTEEYYFALSYSLGVKYGEDLKEL